MRPILKIFVTCSTIFFTFASLFHLDEHNHDSFDGYSFCSPECHDDNHHSDHHQCIKCLNKNSKATYNNWASKETYKKVKIARNVDSFVAKASCPFYLFSRPPPKLL